MEYTVNQILYFSLPSISEVMTRGLYFKHWGVENVFSSLHLLVSEIIPLPMSWVVAGMTCHHITNHSYYKIHASCFSLGNQL